MRAHARSLALCAVVAVFSLGANGTCADRPWTSPHEGVGRDLFTSPQADPVALSPDGTRLYVANTTSNTVSLVR